MWIVREDSFSETNLDGKTRKSSRTKFPKDHDSSHGTGSPKLDAALGQALTGKTYSSTLVVLT